MTSSVENVGGYRLKVLGSLRLEADDGVIVARELFQRQARLVLTALALEPLGVHRDALGELLWGDAPPPSRDQTLSAVVSRLRRLLARTGLPATLTYTEGVYRLNRAAHFVDVDEASTFAARARVALASGDHSDAFAAATAAILLLDEPVPPEWDGELFERARRRVERLAREASAIAVDAALAIGDASAAVAAARRRIDRDPLDEDAYQRLLRALAAGGDRAGGLRAYEQCRSMLVEQLGVDPSPATEALYLELLGATAPALSVDQRLAGLPLPALLARPESLFCGRRTEMAMLNAAWRETCATSRPVVVALVGPTGSGRGALAARAAQDVHATGGLVLAGRAAANAADQAPFVEALAPLAAALADDGAFRPSLPPSAPYDAEELARALRRTEQPALLVLHEGDELDEKSTTLLSQLRAHDARLLVVLCMHKVSLSVDTIISLTPLDGDDVAALANALLGEVSHPLLDDLASASGSWPGPLLEVLREHLRSRVAAAADRAAAARRELGGATSGLAEHLRHLSATGDLINTGNAGPYKGLGAYEIDDAANFHGRHALVGELVGLLGARGLVAVVGASGSGKSSFVRAGVLSALAGAALPESDRWTCEIVRPGAQTLRKLAEQLTFGHLAEADLIFIDQFEEVFTAAEPEEDLTALIDAIVDTAESRRVVLAMRADFYERCAVHRHLSTHVQRSHVLVGPMLAHELRSAIEQPAAQLGVRFAPDVVDALIADVAGRPGALPLLSTALEGLWEARRSRLITGEDLVRSGGVIGAVGRLAEAALLRLDDDGQAIARRLLLRLCAISEHGDDVARQAPLGELVGNDDNLASVLDVLIAGRLVVVDQDSVRLAHEALLREWPRLRAWLDDDRHKRIQLQQLRAAAHAWDSGGRNAADLYRDARLSATADIVGDDLIQVPAVEHEFLVASRAEAAADAVRIERRHHRVRAFAVVVAFMAIVAAGAAVVAVHQRDRASRAANDATVERLVVQASSLRDEDAVVSALLALEANDIEDSIRTRGAVLNSLAQPIAFRGVLRARSAVTAMATDIARTRIIVGDDGGEVTVWNTRTMESETTPVVAHGGPVRSVAVAADGSAYATAGDDGSVQWWDGESATRKGRPWTYSGARGARVGVATLRFAPDGSLLVLGRDGGVVRMTDPVHSSEPELYVEEPAQPYDGGTLQTIDPGANLLVNPGDGGLLVWRVGAPAATRLAGILFYAAADRLTAIAAGPNGEVIAVADERRLTLWNGDDLQRRQRVDLARTITALSFSENGARLAAGLADGTVAVIDVASGALLGDLVTGSPDAPQSIAFGQGGQLFVGTAAGVAVRDLDQPTLGRRLPEHAGEARAVVFLDDGRHLAAAGSGPASVWSLDSTNAPQTIGRPRAEAVARIPGGMVAVASADTIIIFDPDASPNAGDEGIIRTIRAPFGQVTALAENGGGLLAVGSRSGGLALMDAQTGSLLATAPESHSSVVDSIIFLEDQIISASADGVWTWSTDDGVNRAISDSSSLLGARALAASPDGRVLAVGVSAGLILLDLAQSASPVPILGVHGPARGVAWSPDGSMVAAAFDDGDVIVLDGASHSPIGAPLHVERANGVAWSPNGELLAATGLEGDVVVFDMSTARWREIACSIAGRTLTRDEWNQYLPGRSYRPDCG